MRAPSQHWYIQSEDDPSIAERLIEHLDGKGYKPLIRLAKESFVAALGGALPDALTPADETSNLQVVGMVRAATLKGQLAAGDLFRAAGGHGALYVAFYRGGGLLDNPRLQAGAVGDSATVSEFDNFFSLVKSSHPETKDRLWLPLRVFSAKFVDLSKDSDVKFVPGNSVRTEDIEKSRVLEDAIVRSLAIRIKSSGGILEGDLSKGAKAESGDAEIAPARLDEAGLLAREHVIICRKSSNLVNRVDDPEKIEQMSKMGVLCSCGAPIKNERIERFLRPTENLVRLLDGSFWMTARLVEALAKQGVSKDRILLTVQQGTEEVDAFVDIDGTLLVFELKDSLFSMGHAYSFGARLGLYKPKFGIVLTTKGAAPEVKTHFERIKPDAKIVYVERMENLEAAVAEIVRPIRSEWELDLLSQFDPLARVDLSPSEIIAKEIGISPGTVKKKKSSWSFSDYVDDSTFTWLDTSR